MTKRNHRFEENNNKKPKLDNDIDALWGDDLDETVLDVLATQVEDKVHLTQTNSSIVPSYNVFKEPAGLFCSTQLDPGIRPTTSHHIFLSARNDQKNEFEMMIRKYEEREGEVTILRNQLKDLKSRFSNEQQQLVNEWKAKITITEKQALSVRSELEFKNLEIANLKQKLTDVVKGALNMSSKYSEVKTNALCKEKKEAIPSAIIQRRSKNSNLILKENFIPVQPLMRIVTETFFQCSKCEKHYIDTKQMNLSRNSIPYLQNQKVTARIVVERNNQNITDIVPTVLHLVNCSRDELELDVKITYINKIICMSLQCLINLRDLLEDIKHNLRTEDILEVDADYLKKNIYCNESGKYHLNDEIGFKGGLLLNVISSLLEHNTYLKNYLCQNSRMKLREDSFFDKFQNSVKKQYGHDFLNKIIQIVKITGEIRRVNIMTSFLNASLDLFINICEMGNYESVQDIVCRFTKELIFLRPQHLLVFRITRLLKICSKYPSFVEFILNKSKQNATNKKGVVYFNEDACRFYVFVMLFDNCISSSESVPMNVTLDLLAFIYNTCKTSNWLHHQNVKECDCMPQLYKLEMEVIFRALEIYVEDTKLTKCRTSVWEHFFQNRIVTKVLNLMMFHSDELTEKYITVFSQFKEIEQQLQEKNLGNIITVDITDAVPIPSSKFDTIDF